MTMTGPMTATGMTPSLPSACYRDDGFFARERAEVMTREWICAGRVADLPPPGDFRPVELAGQSLIVARDRDGAIHAHYNTCRHRGARLCDPASDARWGVRLEGAARGLIRCPYHGWTFGLDGALLAAPDMGATPGFAKADFALHPVGVKVWGGFVFLCLRPDAARDFDAGIADAARRLANYPLADLMTGDVRSYDVHANWKVICENYNECYHCPGVHPELCEIVPAFRENGGIGLDWELGVPHRPGAVTYTATGTTNRAPFPGLSEIEKVRHKGEMIYPNLMLSVSMDHCAAFVLTPLAADRTRIDCHFLFHPDAVTAPDFAPEDAIEFWDLVNRQDWAVCERVQAGMGALPHDHGWYAPMEDWSLDIRRWLAARMDF